MLATNQHRKSRNFGQEEVKVEYSLWVLSLKGMKMNVEDLFKQGPLEGIVSSCIRDTIIAHGPVTRETVGSASKRIVAAFRGRVLDIFRSHHEKLPVVSQSEQILQLQKEVSELKNRVNRANKQERRWRKKLVENNIPLDGEVKLGLDDYASTIRLAFENLYGNDDRDYERFNLFDVDTVGEIHALAKNIEEGQ